MSNIAYRLFFDNTPATREQLDRVEEITVEQEIDMAWEARLEIPIETNEQGRWSGEDEAFMADFARIRVEIRLGDSEFIPLIDGPIVGFDSQMDSQPEQSSRTLRVQDDSVYLNRQDQIFLFEDLLDHEIVSQVFADFEQIASTEIEETPAPTSSQTPVVVQRGTAMHLLRFLARRQGMHAYVLPGEDSGQSLGCFKQLPIQSNGLPPLILLGNGRNVDNFSPRNDAQRAARISAYTLSLRDKTISQRTSNLNNLDLLGDEPTFAQESDTAVQILCPHQGDAVDLEQAVTAEALSASYVFEATGTVIDGAYSGVLTPYRVVTVRGVNSRLSGDYLISRVTHSLTRSNYTQSFTLRRNAQSRAASPGLRDLAGSIF